MAPSDIVIVREKLGPLTLHSWIRTSTLSIEVNGNTRVRRGITGARSVYVNVEIAASKVILELSPATAANMKNPLIVTAPAEMTAAKRKNGFR